MWAICLGEDFFGLMEQSLVPTGNLGVGEICLEFSCLTLSFPHSFISSAEILSISTVDIWNRIAVCGSGFPVHCRVLSRTPGFYLLHLSSIPSPAMMSPAGEEEQILPVSTSAPVASSLWMLHANPSPSALLGIPMLPKSLLILP